MFGCRLAADLSLAGGSNDADIVTFGYDYGEGHVIYSPIPLDFYSAGASVGLIQAEAEAYAANVIDCGAKQAFDLAWIRGDPSLMAQKQTDAGSHAGVRAATASGDQNVVRRDMRWRGEADQQHRLPRSDAIGIP